MTQGGTTTTLRPTIRQRLARWRRRTLRGAGAFIALGVALWCAKEIALRLVPFDSVPHYPRGAVIIQDREGHDLAGFVGEDDAWSIPLASEDISPFLKQAIVAVEDRRFASHRGVDWYSAAGAAWQDIRALRPVRGASTLTMQVVRLREHQSHGWLGKAEQAFRAQQLELGASKDQILTEYINRAPFGGNLVGAEAASWRYFGKHCRDLSLGQAALLAGLPQSPNRLRPDKSPDMARPRRAHVLSQMLDAGLITQAQADTANAEPIDAEWRPLPQRTTQQAWGAMPTLARLAGRTTTDADKPGRIRTTLDSRTQQAAGRAMDDAWPELSANGIDSGCIVVVDVSTGEVRAAVSRSTTAAKVDLTRAPRSTGSVLKPFLYAAGFDMGLLTPQTQLLDSPKAWSGYVPSNFDREYRGNMPAADALAESRNIPAMTVLAKVGVSRSVSVLETVGICTPARTGRNYGLSLAIGGAEATPLEVADGYATLARGGERLPVHLFAEAKQKSTRVLRADICWQTLSCINQRARTEAVPGGLAAAEMDAGWKTGTSNGYRDAWCAAATPRTVVVVWLGNAQGKGSAGLIGQAAAAPLALGLVGRIDPGGPTWPGSRSQPGADRLAVNTRLSVVAPAGGTEILTTSDTQQTVALTSAGGSGERRWWFANGDLVATSQGGPALWRPTAGVYELRVVDESGAGAAVRVQVR